MNHIIKIVIAAAILGAIVFFMSGDRTTAPGGGEVVTIGFIGPLSGDAAAFGEQIQHVVSYRLTEINARNAREGKPRFEMVYEDGKCAGNDAVSAFQKLTDVDGVKIIIGGACSSETMAIAPLAAERHIVALSGWSSNPAIESIGPYTFSLSYSDRLMATTLANEMGSFNKVAIVGEQNDFNEGWKKVWLEIIATHPNAKVVADETFPKGASDFRNTLEKVRRASPDAIFLNPNVGVTAENLLRQLAEIKGWTGYKLYSHFAYLADSARAPVGTFADGMVIIDTPSLASEKFLALKAKIEAEKGTLADLGDFYSATAIDVVDTIAALVEELGNDPEKIRNALAQRTWEGMIGTIYFGGKNFVQNIPAGRFVIENQKAVPRAK